MMKIDKLPGGLWPVMLTPFLDNNEIDIEGLKVLVKFYINAGATGLFSCCLSSEMFQLTDRERLLINRTVVETTASKVPVVAAGTFGRDMKKCADFIKEVYDTGVAAVIVITNQLADIGEEEDVIKKKITLLLKLTGDIPLGLYECPAPYKRLLSAELIRWLGKTGRFLYHKDTSCDLRMIKNKVEAVRETPLALYNANTTTALTSMEYGAAGISPIGANFYPELYTFLIDKYTRKGMDEILIQLNAQLDMMDAVADQCYPFSAKLFLQQRGLPITTVCRIPSGRMHPENHLKLQALMDVFVQTSERFGIVMKAI